MTSIQEVYEAYASGPLSEVGLHAFHYVPGESEFPAAYLLSPRVDYEGLANNWGKIRVDIVVFVSASMEQHQLKLLPYQDHVGASSINQAILANPSLGFPDVHVTLSDSRPLNLQEQAGYKAFGAMFETTCRLS